MSAARWQAVGLLHRLRVVQAIPYAGQQHAPAQKQQQLAAAEAPPEAAQQPNRSLPAEGGTGLAICAYADAVPKYALRKRHTCVNGSVHWLCRTKWCALERGSDIWRAAPWCARAATHRCRTRRAHGHAVARLRRPVARHYKGAPNRLRRERAMIELILLTFAAACTGGLMLRLVLHRGALGRAQGAPLLST